MALVGLEGVEAYLPLAGLVDLEQEVARLNKWLAAASQEIQRAEEMLANEARRAGESYQRFAPWLLNRCAGHADPQVPCRGARPPSVRRPPWQPWRRGS